MFVSRLWFNNGFRNVLCAPIAWPFGVLHWYELHTAKRQKENRCIVKAMNSMHRNFSMEKLYHMK